MAQFHFPDGFTRYIINGQSHFYILIQLEGYPGFWIEGIGIYLLRAAQVVASLRLGPTDVE